MRSKLNGLFRTKNHSLRFNLCISCPEQGYRHLRLRCASPCAFTPYLDSVVPGSGLVSSLRVNDFTKGVTTNTSKDKLEAFSGMVVRARYLASLDSLGEGIPYSGAVGRRPCYPIEHYDDREFLEGGQS